MGSRNIIIVLGSPRKEGNSATLAGQVALGAEAQGAQVERFFVSDKDVGPCTACDACRNATVDDCVLRDDMVPLYPKLRSADALVIASAIYWFTVSAQTKLFMDRCYALGGPQGNALAGKQVAVILTYADPDPFCSGAVNALRMFQDGFRYVGADLVEMIYGRAGDAGEIRSNKELMERAYRLGARLAAG